MFMNKNATITSTHNRISLVVAVLLVAVIAAMGMIVTSHDSNAAAVCNFNQIKQAKDQGKIVVHATEWKKGRLTIVNKSTCALPLRLVSFIVAGQPFPGSISTSVGYQKQYAISGTGTVQPGGMGNFDVAIPNCRFQIDMANDNYPDNISKGVVWVWGQANRDLPFCPVATPTPTIPPTATPTPTPTATPTPTPVVITKTKGLSVQKTDRRDTIEVGQKLNYEIKVENIGEV